MLSSRCSHSMLLQTLPITPRGVPGRRGLAFCREIYHLPLSTLFSPTSPMLNLTALGGWPLPKTSPRCRDSEEDVCRAVRCVSYRPSKPNGQVCNKVRARGRVAGEGWTDGFPSDNLGVGPRLHEIWVLIIPAAHGKLTFSCLDPRVACNRNMDRLVPIVL